MLLHIDRFLSGHVIITARPWRNCGLRRCRLYNRSPVTHATTEKRRQSLAGICIKR